MVDRGADPLGSNSTAIKLLGATLRSVDTNTTVRLLDIGIDSLLTQEELSSALRLIPWSRDIEAGIALSQLLVDCGARFNQRHLYTAFVYAILPEVTWFMLENSDQMDFDPGEGRNLLTLICRKEYSSEQEEDDHFAVFELLLENGALPNTVEPMPSRLFMGRAWMNDGTTPLISAIGRHDPRFVRALLDHGADPELTTASGCAPLIIAIFSRNSEAVQQLLEAGADPFRKTGHTAKKESPLELACRLAKEHTSDEPCKDAILSYLANHPCNQ